MPNAEGTRTIILCSDLDARRRARECRDRPWLHNAGSPWNVSINWASDTPDWGTVKTLVEPPEPSASLDIPFRDQHYFREFLLESIEECFNDYARDNLWEQLGSASWRAVHSEDLPARLQNGQSWLESGVIELTDWTRLFRHIALPGVVRDPSCSCALMRADQLRHTTIHREQLPIEILIPAIQIVRRLNYQQKADTIQQTCDLWLNENTRKEAMRFLLTPRKITRGYQLLGRLQNLMEESFFNYTRRVNPGLLVLRKWKVFEQVELQHWQVMYQRSWNAPWDAPYREFCSDRGLLSIALDVMRGMRNSASHRSRIDKWEAMEYLKHSMLLAILMDDQYQAVAIEIVGEQWLTSSSRSDVLMRLQDVFLEDTDLGIGTTEQTPEGALVEETQDDVPEDFEAEDNQAEDLEARDTAEWTLAYEGAEIQKRKSNRERKRRYAIAKVIMSAELDNSRQRSRALPYRSALKSLLLNLPIPDDDKGLVNEDGSVVEQEAVTGEAQAEADALSLQDLVGKPKDEDQGWFDQDTSANSWASSYTNVESSTTESVADTADKVEAEVKADLKSEAKLEGEAEGEANAEAEAEAEAEEEHQAEAEVEGEAQAEAIPDLENEPTVSDRTTTEKDQAVAFEAMPLVSTPMFGEYHAVYQQMLSKSMHDVYKLTDDEMRERNWQSIFRAG